MTIIHDRRCRRDDFSFWSNHFTDCWSDCSRFVDDTPSKRVFKEKKEGKKEEVSNKQVLISLLIAIVGIAGFLLAIDDIAAFLNN